jgi:hypothetical protein
VRSGDAAVLDNFDGALTLTLTPALTLTLTPTLALTLTQTLPLPLARLPSSLTILTAQSRVPLYSHSSLGFSAWGDTGRYREV